MAKIETEIQLPQAAAWSFWPLAYGARPLINGPALFNPAAMETTQSIGVASVVLARGLPNLTPQRFIGRQGPHARPITSREQV